MRKHSVLPGIDGICDYDSPYKNEEDQDDESANDSTDVWDNIELPF